MIAARALQWPLLYVAPMLGAQALKAQQDRPWVVVRPGQNPRASCWTSCFGFEWAHFQSATSQWLQLPAPSPSSSAASMTASSSTTKAKLGHGERPGVPQLPRHEEAKGDGRREGHSRGGPESVSAPGTLSQGWRQWTSDLGSLCSAQEQVATLSEDGGSDDWKALEEEETQSSDKAVPAPASSLPQRVLKHREKDRANELIQGNLISGQHCEVVKDIPCGTRAHNLRIRSPTPCPLGQGDLMTGVASR